MDEVLLNKPCFSIEDGSQVASATILINGVSYELKYKVSEGPIAHNSDAFLAACLFPAMKLGRTLQINGNISPKLLDTIQTIQDIFHKWYPEFQKISVLAEPKKPDNIHEMKDIGCFFSGGLDSFYTLLKHRDEITKIIFVHGFDIWLNDSSHRTMVSREIQKASSELNLPVVEVETNTHEFLDAQGLSWPFHSFGSVLAGVALLLSPQFKKIYIPSSESYAHLDPCGSHPLLDPLWSTEDIEIIHDGCEANRVEKAFRVAQSDVALRTLRVCYQNLRRFGDNHHDEKVVYNCGSCEKCLRTMINLYVVGALERCRTFRGEIDIDKVARMQIDHDLALYHVEDNLYAVEKKDNNSGVAQSLQDCINNYKNKKLVIEINKNLHQLIQSDAWKELVKNRRETLFKSLWGIQGNWMSKEVLKEKVKGLDKKLLKGTLLHIFKILSRTKKN